MKRTRIRQRLHRGHAESFIATQDACTSRVNTGLRVAGNSSVAIDDDVPAGNDGSSLNLYLRLQTRSGRRKQRK
jgi:hypothetical protein